MYVMWIVKHGDSLSKEAVESPAMETFKSKLNRHLADLI